MEREREFKLSKNANETRGMRFHVTGTPKEIWAASSSGFQSPQTETSGGTPGSRLQDVEEPEASV